METGENGFAAFRRRNGARMKKPKSKCFSIWKGRTGKRIWRRRETALPLPGGGMERARSDVDTRPKVMYNDTLYNWEYMYFYRR